ncbi:MAG: ATP phosphoribosyltransferase regulatory subunit, partial [Dehalococcoidia bacterium]|nr:ATP phosphoribosyltransferase regulatory subunit [Dehalococcoidia bacterium]
SEGTIPAARLYLENLEGSEIARLFYVENTFTFEETGKERRERWQCGAELIGSSQPLADVELVLLALEALGKLGIAPLEVRLSHAGLIKALLGELGLGTAEQTQIFDQILEGNIKALGEIKTEDVDLKRALAILLEVKGSSPGFLENVRALLGKALPRLEPSLNNLVSIAQLLAAMDCPYQIDIASGSGFEYYTGVMFQFYAAAEQVGGGGRYDDLIPLVGGPPVPASGFALYMDQLMNLVKMEERSYQRILVLSQGSDMKGLKACFEVARSLREAGYLVELDLGQKEVSCYRWILSVSSEGLFRLTDQTTGRESELASAAQTLKIMEGSG